LERSYCNPQDPAKWFVDHLTQDWTLLRSMVRRSDDDLAMLVHSALVGVRADAPGDEKKAVAAGAAGAAAPAPGALRRAMLAAAAAAAAPAAAAPAAAAAAGAPAAAAAGAGAAAGAAPAHPLTAAILRSGEERSAWEVDMVRHLAPLTSDALPAQVEAAYKRFSDGKEDEGSVFIAELMERYDLVRMLLLITLIAACICVFGPCSGATAAVLLVAMRLMCARVRVLAQDAMEAKARALASPALWRFRSRFSLQDFRMEMNLVKDHEVWYSSVALGAGAPTRRVVPVAALHTNTRPPPAAGCPALRALHALVRALHALCAH
jgi:hypothetical protein